MAVVSLKKKKDFERVLKLGKGFKKDFIFLKIIKNDLKVNRFGLIVGQKISKKATLRNKIKRRLRVLIKTKLSKLEPGFDLILLAMPGLEAKDYWEMEEILNKLFKRANIQVK